MTPSRKSRSLRRRAPETQTRSPESQWFWDHYEWAAGEIVDMFAGQEISLAGRRVADVGSGDGIMALGLCQKAKPARLTGFDVRLTDSANLLRRATEEGVATELPPELEFRESTPEKTSAQDGEFEIAYSWSAFEHIADPTAVLSEIRRILTPTGTFMLQLWPFYLSARGSHLWEWFPDEFHHLRSAPADVAAELRASSTHPERTAYMADEFDHLNRITLAGLQRAVLASGFDVRRLELITLPTALTPDIGWYSWADLAVSGIKLIATPRR